MDEHGLAAMTARLLGVPRSAPRLLRDLAGLTVVAVLVLSPNTITRAVEIYVAQTTERVTSQLTPILTDLMTIEPADPADPAVPADPAGRHQAK